MVNLLAIPASFLIGTINVALIDIIALIVLLIAVIVGLSRGFLRQVLSLLGLVAGIVVAIIFCDELVALVNENIPAIPTAIENAIANSNAFKDLTGSFTNEEQIIASLENSSIPAFLHGTIAKAIVESNFELEIIKVFTTWALYVIVFIVTVILSLIIFAIIKKILYGLTRIKLIGFVDKLLGMIFSVAVTLVNMMIIITILSLFMNVNAYIQPEGTICYFNNIMTKALEMPFIQELLSTTI
ncbi:MAG: CvpA family protein [Clostridia bacterium]|nr:CvpA family protein [Clostridia bacterium]